MKIKQKRDLNNLFISSLELAKISIENAKELKELRSRLEEINMVNQELIEALKDAKSHLEFINYGDKYERECAIADRLPERLKKILEKSGGLY